MRFLPFTVVTYLFLASIPAGAAEIDVSGLKFRADIQPLLAKYCFRCHGQQEPEAGVTLSRIGTTQEMLEEDQESRTCHTAAAQQGRIQQHDARSLGS